jgi:hypothetical protein
MNVSFGSDLPRVLPRFLLVCLGLSLALNVILARRSGQQRELVEQLRTQNQPLLNQVVPPLTGTDLTGQPLTITFSDTGEPTLLYIFEPDCGWCAENHGNAVALARQSQGKFRMIAVALSNENLEDYLSRHPMDCPVITNLEPGLVERYRFGVTPQTIVVSHEGVVQRNWRGAYQEESQRQIQDYLEIKLPGTRSS